MLVLAAVLAKGHVLLEDFPGLGKTLAARSFAQALGLDFARAQFTPDLLPADLTGSFLYDQRARRVRVPPRPAVHRAAAGRRDQPHAAQDPVGAARGDAGAPGHRRGRDLPAARALPRARDRQPDRVRRHLPAARGAARPVPAAGQLRLPHRATRSTTSSRRRLARQPGGGRRSTRSPTPPGCSAMQAAVETVDGRRERRPLLRRPRRGHPRRTPTCSPAPRRAARSAWCWPPAASRCCAAATTSSPRT